MTTTSPAQRLPGAVAIAACLPLSGAQDRRVVRQPRRHPVVMLVFALSPAAAHSGRCWPRSPSDIRYVRRHWGRLPRGRLDALPAARHGAADGSAALAWGGWLLAAGLFAGDAFASGEGPGAVLPLVYAGQVTSAVLVLVVGVRLLVGRATSWARTPC